MSDKRKTVLDIAAEMRNYSNICNDGYHTDYRVVCTDMRNYADRLEAAYKREMEKVSSCSVRSTKEAARIIMRNGAVNAAKMYEALTKIEKGIMLRRTGLQWYKSDSLILDIVEAALAAPSRNCDRLKTLEGALAAWREVSPAESGPFDEWLFSEVKGGEK